MNISMEDIVRIAKGFGGHLRSKSSLEFAIDVQKNKKLGEYKKLAYLVRSILVDHPFSDGNKKTAMIVIFSFAQQNDKIVDEELIKHHVLSIASKNITNIKNIEWRLKNGVK